MSFRNLQKYLSLERSVSPISWMARGLKLEDADLIEMNGLAKDSKFFWSGGSRPKRLTFSEKAPNEIRKRSLKFGRCPANRQRKRGPRLRHEKLEHRVKG